MKLKPFVKSERVVIGIEDGSREEILQQLMQPLVADGDLIDDPDQFLGDLIRREDRVTTVLGQGVAFPHARSTGVKRLCLSIGVAAGEGVHFGPDEQTVTKLLFCIGIPSYAPTAHMPILKSLATYVNSSERVERLVNCTLPSQVVRYLANYKG